VRLLIELDGEMLWDKTYAAARRRQRAGAGAGAVDAPPGERAVRVLLFDQQGQASRRCWPTSG
jgi:hypothetical protein